MSSPSPAVGGDFGQVRELPSIHQFLSSADRGDQGREVLVLRGTRAVVRRVREPPEAECPEGTVCVPGIPMQAVALLGQACGGSRNSDEIDWRRLPGTKCRSVERVGEQRRVAVSQPSLVAAL